MTEREFVDFATVRDKLLEAIERRGEISYEQTMALQHAEWKASASGHRESEHTARAPLGQPTTQHGAPDLFPDKRAARRRHGAAPDHEGRLRGMRVQRRGVGR